MLPDADEVIKLPFPPSTNTLFANVRGKGRVKTERYKTWIAAAGWDVKGAEPVDGPYHLEIVLKRPDNRRRDLDNCIKAISDLLVEHGITPDDSLCQGLTVQWSDAKMCPLVKVKAG